MRFSLPGPAARYVVARRAAALAAVPVLALVPPACSSDDSSGAPSPTSTGDLALTAGSTGSLGGSSSGTGAPVRKGRVEVVREMPHDPALFTQGLQVVGDEIYESTGTWGRSLVQRRPITGGPASAQVALPPEQFGEGMAVTSDTAWSITWKDGVAYNRDPRTLDVRSTVRYQGEGWGLCAQGDRLVMSDGSEKLTFRDPHSFAPTGTVTVTRDGVPVRELNELECAGPEVYANVWGTDDIVRIDPTTGKVTATYDASALQRPRPTDPNAVLNGIAALPGTGTFLVTGKYWPTMYEVRFVD